MLEEFSWEIPYRKHSGHRQNDIKSASLLCLLLDLTWFATKEMQCTMSSNDALIYIIYGTIMSHFRTVFGLWNTENIACASRVLIRKCMRSDVGSISCDVLRIAARYRKIRFPLTRGKM